jgi:WhiB family transcriptional regulator, redox-sensing transcriptional regulator
MDGEPAPLIRWLMQNDDQDAVQYLAELMRRPVWMDEAACRGVDTDLFFPGLGESTLPAKAICSGCPVSADCLMYAMEGDSHDDFGVWGGTSAKQRRQLRSALPRSAQKALAG